MAGYPERQRRKELSSPRATTEEFTERRIDLLRSVAHPSHPHRSSTPVGAKSLRAKVRAAEASSTTVLLKASDVVIEAEFGELTPCEFPIWTSTPVPVEIPPEGSKRFVVQPFSGLVAEKAANGELPGIVKFPVYREQGLASAEAFDGLPVHGGSLILTKAPLAALATLVSGVVDGRLVQTHCVLPLWSNGAAVLVRLDWCEGECGEGSPNPEWHMNASTGLPAALGLAELEAASRLPVEATHCLYQIHITPWLLGAQLLEDKGQATEHRVWQREWQFDDFSAFSDALTRITCGLLGTDPTDRGDAA